MGSLWPFPAFSVSPLWKKLHEWRFLISPRLHNEAAVAQEVMFCECRKSPNNVAFDEAVKLPRVSQALSVWPFFNDSLLQSFNTSSLTAFSPRSVYP